MELEIVKENKNTVVYSIFGVRIKLPNNRALRKRIEGSDVFELKKIMDDKFKNTEKKNIKMVILAFISAMLMFASMNFLPLNILGNIATALCASSTLGFFTSVMISQKELDNCKKINRRLEVEEEAINRRSQMHIVTKSDDVVVKNDESEPTSTRIKPIGDNVDFSNNNDPKHKK